MIFLSSNKNLLEMSPIVTDIKADFNPLAEEYSWSPLEFDFTSGEHIIVYIHIQKTGGSEFLAHITTSKSLEGRQLCKAPSEKIKIALKKRRDFMICPLVRTSSLSIPLPEMWLASEKTYGWVCGVHPFLQEMYNCLPNYLTKLYGHKSRIYHYLTVIRHPVMRYVSEYLHVKRGATWASKHYCNGRSMDNYIPPCYNGYYNGVVWKNVSFKEFLSCSSNWANNRQTFMLADLDKVYCLNSTAMIVEERERILLETAKESLKRLSFFAVSEYMVESGMLFEHRFNVKLGGPIKQKQLQHLHSSSLLYEIWTNTTLFNTIVSNNKLDMQLYQYALNLFNNRAKLFNMTLDLQKLENQIYNLKFHHESK